MLKKSLIKKGLLKIKIEFQNLAKFGFNFNWIDYILRDSC
jgi:hypothetical protein